MSGPLSITKTSVEFWPTNGNLNSVTRGVRPTSKRFAPFFLFKINFCPVLKGWLGICNVLVGIEIVSFISPTILSTFIAPPAVVPTPTDCGPLKKIISLKSDSNWVVFTGMVIRLFKTSTVEPSVCAIPACLCTLITFLIGNTFNTLRTSESDVFAAPTLNEPPIETLLGIDVT